MIRQLRSLHEIPPGAPRRYRNGSGYIRLRWLVGPQTYVEVYEHRLAAGLPPPWLHVHHINGDKGDNRRENLQIMDVSEHAELHGRDVQRDPDLLGYRSAAARDKALRSQERRRERLQNADRAARWYRDGATTGEIGDRLGIDASTASRLLRKAGVPKAQGRVTGPSREMRKLVADRSWELCEVCGDKATQIHHRLPRQMGGTTDEKINCASNLLHLCLRCHGWIESHRERSYCHGYLLRRHQHPSTTPVLIRGGALVILTEDGGYEPWGKQGWRMEPATKDTPGAKPEPSS